MTTRADDPLLAVRGVSKAFGGTKALTDFDLELRAGEVHALVGGNGSGKSTFIKILAGVHQADAGAMQLAGGDYDLSKQTPEDAQDGGLRFVHQDLGIFAEMSVLENLHIGRGYPRNRVGGVDWRSARKAARSMLDRFHLGGVSPETMAGALSTPQRAMLAIARALHGQDAGVLVLDEPTASLPPDEANLLMASIRRLAASGHSVLLVTHRLDEVREVADKVTCLRDGRLAGTMDGAGLSEDALIELILGHRLTRAAGPSVQQREMTSMLQVEGLSGGPVSDVDISVRSGEIVGIAGLLGSGRSELLHLIFGTLPATGGTVVVDGAQRPTGRPGNSVRSGVALVPEDRQADAVFESQTVLENMTVGDLKRYTRGFTVRRRKARAAVLNDIGRFKIRAEGPETPIENLSGGNQQKVVLARWIRSGPLVLLLDEPTQGIDVGSREDIYGLISEAADQGTAVVVVSSEFEELSRLCSRVIVFARGQVVGELHQPFDTEDVLAAVLAKAERLA
jgi:ribose transport system ATP-binding protein